MEIWQQAGEMGGGCHRRQHSNSSTNKVPSSENVNDSGSPKFYAPTSSNPDSAGNSMGSLGAVNRPTVSRSLHSVPRCNPNSLSVGDRPSFPPSSSGDRWNPQKHSFIIVYSILMHYFILFYFTRINYQPTIIWIGSSVLWIWSIDRIIVNRGTSAIIS